MIRYSHADLAAIRARIDIEFPNWCAKADQKTAELIGANMFIEGPPKWSEIKSIFMEFQYNKCCFCERPLGGRIEQDVEHFRPKNAVKLWARAKGSPYTGPVGGAGSGYFWLAYRLDNYASSCKDCNTIRKSNYFPIAGAQRGAVGQDVSALNAVERPLIIFPLGTIDSDPESLISFDGIIATPNGSTPFDIDRGWVTIEFFGFNDREELWADRFRTISDIWSKIQIIKTHSDPAQVAAAQRGIKDATSDAGPQASCARSFLRLVEREPLRAWQTYLSAENFVKSSPSRPKPRRRRKANVKAGAIIPQ